MKTNVFFAICRYVPSLLRGEKVNVGFAYHIPSIGLIGFSESKNTRRIRSFDDELEIDMIHAIFESLSYDFSSENLDDYDEYDAENLHDPELLKKKIYNYVNQIQFSDVSVYESDDDLDQTLIDIADMYLYYDKPKNSRMNHQRVQSLARKIINSSAYRDSLSKSFDKDVFYNLPYDFKVIIDGKTKYIKGLSFDYKQANRFFKEVKTYLFDLNHEISKGQIDISDIKIVINNTDLDKSHEKIIQEYLPLGLDLVTLERFGDYINHPKNNFLN